MSTLKIRAAIFNPDGSVKSFMKGTAATLNASLESGGTWREINPDTTPDTVGTKDDYAIHPFLVEPT